MVNLLDTPTTMDEGGKKQKKDKSNKKNKKRVTYQVLVMKLIRGHEGKFIPSSTPATRKCHKLGQAIKLAMAYLIEETISVSVKPPPRCTSRVQQPQLSHNSLKYCCGTSIPGFRSHA